uniref:Uncharacterized protein n=1 Tax=Ciona savignyi TaxID=51511 RepID=H2Y457_CIOSA
MIFLISCIIFVQKIQIFDQSFWTFEVVYMNERIWRSNCRIINAFRPPNNRNGARIETVLVKLLSNIISTVVRIFKCKIEFIFSYKSEETYLATS